MFDEQALKNLAAQWVARMEGDDAIDERVENDVVEMNFTAPPETQWAFIMAAVRCSDSDTALTHLAVGPLEHLLGQHGDQYIARVEEEARRTPRFARMLTGAWQHQMSPTVWMRVEAIQHIAARAGNKLDPEVGAAALER